MRVKTFDKLAGWAITLSFVYTAVIALSQWDWFPIATDWGHIADIPPEPASYLALLLPWVLLLTYFLVRRLCFKAPFR